MGKTGECGMEGEIGEDSWKEGRDNGVYLLDLFVLTVYISFTRS